MPNFDIVIIGGGPAGIQSAISARNSYPNKTVALIRENKIALIPCGIPYIISRLDSVDDDILPDALLTKNQVEIIIGRVTGFEGKELVLSDDRRIGFTKLVLASGSHALTPDIEGIDKSGVYVVEKGYDYLVRFREAALEARRILIVGGGYIGVELADEFVNLGKQVTVVEMMPNLLGSSMDSEFTQIARNELESRGCEILTETRVERFSGEADVDGAYLSNGQCIEADLAVIAIGYRPNIALAEAFHLKVDEKYGVVVDEYMRTSQKDIFAVGDCAAARNCFTGELSNIKLASAAMAQGRLAGSNLYMITLVKNFPGTLGSFATRIGKTALGVTGLTESQAKMMDVDYRVGTTVVADRHPGKLPGASKTVLKLIFANQCNVLLGAQVAGGDSVGELINMMSVIIQNKMTDMEIDTLQIGTHPLLTSSPLAYPVISATVDAIKKRY
ncbi:NAD(P)/FAD-dependent oxidoreductase [bacterium]|nr:NAD(P)/FAD-dependent oxidoreductase [bacterium]